MKLLILGGTGGTGLEMIKQAIERGHQVTAFVRNSERLAEFGDRINVVRENVLDSGALAKAIEGQDAVLSFLGHRLPMPVGDAELLRRFAAALTSAMQQTKVRRLIVVSVAFLFKDSIVPPAYLIGRLFFLKLVEDAQVMESVIQRSGLDWTIVRPPRLTDKPRTGKYRVREGHLPPFGFKISRADVADYVLKIAEDGTPVGKIIGICN